ISARQQSVVDGQFTAEFVSTSCRLDGIDISYEIGNRYVRRRQLLYVAVDGCQISDRSIVPLFSDLLAAPAANRRVRIIVYLVACNIRRLWTQQSSQSTQNPALSWSS